MSILEAYFGEKYEYFSLSIQRSVVSVCSKKFGDLFYFAVLGVRTVHLEFRVALVFAVGLE